MVSWWWRQILSLVPAKWRRTGEAALFLIEEKIGEERRYGLSVNSPAAQGIREGDSVIDRDSVQSLLGRHKSKRVVLCIPSTQFLERQINLPLASRREVNSILSYEMDRFTPFRAEDVLWNAQVVSRSRDGKRCNVRLRLARKQVVTEAAAWAERNGAVLSGLATTRPDGTECIFPLDAEASRHHPSRIRQHLVLAAGGLATLWILATPFILQEREVVRIERGIEVSRDAAQKASGFQSHILSQRVSVEAIAAERARVGDMLTILAALTSALPDGTYVSDLTVRDGEVSFSGISNAAAALIPRLSAGQIVRSPTFSAPITRTEKGDADLFSIRAAVIHQKISGR